MSLAWAAFTQLSKIWRAEHLPIKLKINIFRAAVTSILLYGCESWILTPELENQVNVFGTRCYRSILGNSLLEHITNAELYSRAQQQPLTSVIRERQLRWLGHALRRDENEPAHIFALYEPEEGLGRAKPGRPKLSWNHYVT